MLECCVASCIVSNELLGLAIEDRISPLFTSLKLQAVASAFVLEQSSAQ